MYNVMINGRFLTQKISGVQRYAIELVKALDNLIEDGEIESGINFTIITPRNIQQQLDLKNINIKRVGILSGHLWEQFELPYFVRGNLLLSLCNTSTVFKRNQIVTIHDSSVVRVPESYSFIFRMVYKLLLPVIGQIAKKIITVSNFAKKDLIDCFHIKEQKINVVYHGIEHVLRDKTEKTDVSGPHKPYILSVGSVTTNRNFSSVILALKHFNITSHKYLIAGNMDTKVFGADNIKIEEQIEYLGHQDSKSLISLYENADFLIIPSLYDSFGFPAVEAMACGCPVIASNSTGLPEICDDAALFCDPYDINDIAKKILMLTRDNDLKETLVARGAARSKLFSWKKCAQETMSIVREELKN